MEVLSPGEGEHILDLGCGTGDLAALIAQKCARVTGIDNSEDMIAAARQKYPHIQFDLKSATDFSYDKAFDAVFSNATLHWVLESEKAIRCIHRSLKPDGRFVAEFGGAGNVALIIDALMQALVKYNYVQTARKQVWYFPSLSTYTTQLEQNGFRVVFAAHFDRPTLLKNGDGVQNWLQMFAWTYLQDVRPEERETLLQDVEKQVRHTNFREGKWFADYVRLRVVAIKQ